MGIFSKPKPIDPMFTLPSVMSRECVEVFLPRKSAFPMSNMRWVEIQFSKKQGQNYWVDKISESESYFSTNKDLTPQIAAIAKAGCEADGFKPNEEAWLTLFVLAKFGLLAGMFEKASNTTKEKDCHPLPWNALKFYSQSLRDEDEKPFGEKHRMLLTYMVYAGYLMGKLEKASPEYVFSHWNN
jgi:hypothetical protein